MHTQCVRHFLIDSIRSELSGPPRRVRCRPFGKPTGLAEQALAQGLLKATLDEIARELEDEMRTAVSSSNVKERSIGQSGLKAK